MTIDPTVNLSTTQYPSSTVTHSAGAIDERVHIRIVGLAAGQRITLHAEQDDDTGNHWQAHAEFLADDHGAVDLDTQQPLAGTYDCVDGMGLLWSMALDSTAARIASFRKTTMNPVTVALRATTADGVLATTTIERLVLAPTIERIVVRADGLAGTLFVPREGGPYPGLIVLGGSGGGIWESPAATLAAHGYACLALAYFAYEQLPAQLANIPLEYFETALTWLQAHPRVDQNRLGVIGTSRGGELALLLGATFPQIRVVVAYVPSNVIWEGFGVGVEAGAPSWSYRGQALPVIHEHLSSEQFQAVVQRKPIAWTPLYHITLDDTSAVAAAAIPVERSQAAILLISGQDVQLWPSARMAAMVDERLQQHGYAYPVRHLGYPNAGHWIGMPFLPASTTYGHHPMNGELYTYGGTVAGNAFAMADSWAQILCLLKHAW
jgi:acetyl esterase/lipase